MGSDTPGEVKASPEADTLFKLDIKGDRQNLAYQSLHQASIPIYRPAGRGNVIGLDRGFRILKSSDTGRKVVVSSLDSGVKQRQHFSPIAESQPSQLLRALPAQKDIITNQVEYVALTSGCSRKRRRLSSERGSDVESGSEDSTDEVLVDPKTNGHDTFDDSVHQRQRTLAEQTSKQPDDIDAWCALLDLQADVVRPSADKHVRLTAAQERTVSDLKISLYQEALSKAKNPSFRERLTSGLMTEGSKVWDRGKQLAEWRRLMKTNPSFDLAVLYLNFLQANQVGFSYEGCLDAYRDCFKRELRRSAGRDRDSNCLYILLRLTNFMKQSGYSELATAVWQGMMELNFYRPASIPHDQALDALEDFWDAECPRFGEPGAKGWCSPTNQQPAAIDEPTLPEPQTKSLYHDWCLSEKIMAIQAELPARTLDNASGDDPYRIVLFSDIRELLFELSSKESEHSLVDALLCFCGQPPLSHSSSWSLWQTDPFLSSTVMLNNSAKDELLPTIPFTGVTEIATLFTPTGPFSALSARAGTQPLSSWSCRAIEQLALSRSQLERLRVYAIALALQSDGPAARKFAKRLIKQNPEDVKLYNAYALVESAVGNQAAAENVWQSTITMKIMSMDEDRNGTLLLWRTWIFEAVRQGNLPGASALIQTISIAPPALDAPFIGRLRSKEAFTRTDDLLQALIRRAISPPISHEHGELLFLTTDLLAMLRYCQSNGDLGPALESYRNVLQIVGNNDFRSPPREILEIMHQHRNQVIHLHVSSSKRTFEPKHILRLLSDSEEQFGLNSIFVALRDQYQRKYGMMDRLRGIALQALSDDGDDSIVQHMQDIHREMSTSEEFGTTEHSIRAVFNRANHQDSETCHCLVTRLAHVRWEIDLMQKKNETAHNSTSKKHVRKQADRAVQSFHAAIRACPWVKELYMLAFESEAMREALGPDGLKQVYETMLERGLRVHIDISEKVEQQSQ